MPVSELFDPAVLASASEEAQEGRDAFLEKRDPDWSGHPYSY